jgi:hypothetical protein
MSRPVEVAPELGGAQVCPVEETVMGVDDHAGPRRQPEESFAATDRSVSAQRHVHAVEVAALFVAAQVGGAARILSLHQRREDGYCAGCATTPTRWPCKVAGIASASLDG